MVTTQDDLTAMGRQYRREATPRKADGDTVSVEVNIDKLVYQAALQRAKVLGQQVRAVARALLYLSAGSLTELADEPPSAPQKRPYGADGGSTRNRYRLRFEAPRGTYTVAADYIRRAGLSRDHVIEQGLRRYAETGDIVAVRPPERPAPDA